MARPMLEGFIKHGAEPQGRLRSGTESFLEKRIEEALIVEITTRQQEMKAERR